MKRRGLRSVRLSWEFGLGRQVALAFWGMFFLEAAFGSYMGIWPLWIERLGAPVAIVGLVLGASGILRLFVLLPSASLAERFGARRLVVAARSAALIGLCGAALATHWTHLAVMVVASALGELAFPLIRSHVSGNTSGNRIRAFTVVFAVGPSLALFATPLLAGALIDSFGLRAAFVQAAVCTAASIAFFWHLSGGDQRLTEAVNTPATYRAALGDRSVRRLLLLQGLTVFSLALGTSLVPTFLEDERGLTPASIASLGALAAIGSTLFGVVVTRTPRLQRAPFIGAAIAVGTTAIGFALFLGTDSPLLIGVAFAFRGGLFSAWSLFSAAIGDVATAANRARSFALSEIFAGLGLSIAPMIAGPIYAANAFGPLSVATTLAAVLVPVLFVAHRASGWERRPDPVAVATGSGETLTPPLDAPAA